MAGSGARVVGVFASGRYGHATGKSYVLAYVAPSIPQPLKLLLLPNDGH